MVFMKRTLKARLSLMMFMEYFIPGCTAPILSHYLLNGLHFTPFQAGVILAMPAAAALIAPFLAAHIADRWISAERFLAVCHLLGGAVMLTLRAQTGFVPFLVLYFVYGMLFIPTHGLTNSVAFHHAGDAKRDFGHMRMWGTAGWVTVGWTFGLFWLRGEDLYGTNGRLADALTLSGLSSWVLALYSLSLPRPAHVVTIARKIPSRPLYLFTHPGLLVLCGLTFLNSAVHQFYYYGTSPFLSEVGLPDRYIMPAMSIGQANEVIMLGLLGICLAKLGVKRAFVVAALAQCVRYVAFAYGGPIPILFGVALHGVCYAFFFSNGYIYVNAHTPPEARAGAQQLYTTIILGAGNLAGSLSAGLTGKLLTIPGTALIHFPRFWLVPAALAFVVAVLMSLFFREETSSESPG